MAIFIFLLSAGLIADLFEKSKKWLSILITAAAILLNFQFFRPDIWYPAGDNYYLSGKEWDRQRSASINDFWPNLISKAPQTPSDGEFINYFPGWNKKPNEKGFISSDGAIFSDTPVRMAGNIISLFSILFFGVSLIKKKWTEKR